MSDLFRPALGAVLAVFASIAPISAAEPFKDFTFRTVKPPARGTKKLINIQIVPDNSDDAAVVSSEPGTKLPQAMDSKQWFWDVISPEITASGPGRFQDALLHLASAPAGQAVPTPRIAGFRRIVADHGTDILLATIGKKVSPALVLAMIGTESAGQVDAQSKAGALGLMQLMPATAERFGVSDTTDAAENIKGGVAYMEWLLERFGGDPILALAGYNAGENAVAKHQGVPPFAETRNYVPKVIAAFQVARALCMTPSELYSDGCVFDLKGGN